MPASPASSVAVFARATAVLVAARACGGTASSPGALGAGGGKFAAGVLFPPKSRLDVMRRLYWLLVALPTIFGAMLMRSSVVLQGPT